MLVNITKSNIAFLSYTLQCAATVVPRIYLLDLSYNNLECINSEYFRNCSWVNLRYLNLSHNNLGIRSSRCSSIDKDPLQFLTPLGNLEILDLSRNNLLQLDISLQMDFLQNLDLSDNMLTCLPQSFTKSLDEANLKRLNTTQPAIQVDLSKNQFPCSCSCLPFYRWLLSTSVELINELEYFCLDDKVEKNISSMDEPILRQLTTNCAIYHDALSALESFLTIILTYAVITIVTVGYRWRHTLHYFYLRMRMDRQKIADILTPEYKFHGFVSCDRAGAKWVKNELLAHLEPKGNPPLGCALALAKGNL